MTTAELVAFVKKNPLPVGCGLVTLVLAVATYFRSDAIPEANQQLDQKTTEAHRYSFNISNGAQLKEHLDALTAANKEISSHLIRASQLGINQQFFYILESESGVKLVDVHQVAHPAAAAKGNFVPVGFSVTVQGKFPALMNFLRSLEGGAHYGRVLTATCTGNRTGTGTITLVLSLELLGKP